MFNYYKYLIFMKLLKYNHEYFNIINVINKALRSIQKLELKFQQVFHAQKPFFSGCKFGGQYCS